METKRNENTKTQTKIERLLIVLKYSALPEDRRGVPRATSGAHIMHGGGDRDLQDDRARLTNQKAGQQEHL